MATAKRPRVVSVVKRRGDNPPPTAPASTPRSAAILKARASRNEAMKPLRKTNKAAKPVLPPEIVREEPHIRKSDDGKALVDRLNPKLLEQLRTRKVTNAAAAQALGVGETYLCRVLRSLGLEKVKGATSAHREERHKLVTTRRQTREMLAKKVNRQEMTIEKAAKEANCSVRTMFRYCAEYANLKKRA